MDVGARYAQALFDLSIETGALEAVEADLRALETMRRESADLRKLIASPTFGKHERGAGLAAIAKRARFHATSEKFLGLLAANGRLSALPAIWAAFQALVAKRRGMVAAQVTTAVAMSAAQSTRIAAALRAALGQDPKIEAKVDPAILGGVRVRVGSRLYDASLKSKLDSLKSALRKA
jgi:F-type H+-transporting ATPase subunit delta